MFRETNRTNPSIRHHTFAARQKLKKYNRAVFHAIVGSATAHYSPWRISPDISAVTFVHFVNACFDTVRVGRAVTGEESYFCEVANQPSSSYFISGV